MDPNLGENQALLATPGADHVQGGRPGTTRVGRSMEGLSIDRNDPAAGLAKARHEFLETRTKLVGFKPAKEPAEGVVARNPIRQLQKPREEILLGLSKDSHIHRVLTTGEDCAQRYHQDLV